MVKNKFKVGDQVVVVAEENDWRIERANKLAVLLNNLLDLEGDDRYCPIEEGLIGTVVECKIDKVNDEEVAAYIVDFGDGQMPLLEKMLAPVEDFEDEEEDGNEEGDDGIDIHIDLYEDHAEIGCIASDKSLEKIEHLLKKYFSKYFEEEE